MKNNWKILLKKHSRKIINAKKYKHRKADHTDRAYGKREGFDC